VCSVVTGGPVPGEIVSTTTTGGLLAIIVLFAAGKET